MGAVKKLGVAALGAALVVSGAANAQTVHRHARHPAAAGHQIVVHARESYLTAGPGADPGQYNGYALDSISATQYMPEIDHTTVGLRGPESTAEQFHRAGLLRPVGARGCGPRSGNGGFPAMTRRFFTLDVFTETPLAGNPLAVVLDAEGLDDRRMQAIAAEFNLSETVFVLEPKNPANTASLRIFTPARELPFAGHPTIGTAALLAHVRAPDTAGGAGREARARGNGRRHRLPRAPPHGPDARRRIRPAEAAGAARSRAADQSRDRRRRRPCCRSDIGFDRHEPSLYSAGAPFLFVPVRSLEAIGRARPGVNAVGGQGRSGRLSSTRARSRRPARPITRGCSAAAGA